MRKFITLAGFAAVALFSAPMASANSGPTMADGKDLFLAEKCDTCHAVKSKGIEASKKNEADLSALKGDADFLKKFVKKEVGKEVEKDGAKKEVKHKKGFKGADADLDTIIKWLKS